MNKLRRVVNNSVSCVRAPNYMPCQMIATKTSLKLGAMLKTKSVATSQTPDAPKEKNGQFGDEPFKRMPLAGFSL
jgi:hypothetical protein